MSAIMNGLLIIGAVEKNRYYLLPSMIINVIGTISLWLLTFIGICRPTIIIEWYSEEYYSQGQRETAEMKSALGDFVYIFVLIVVAFAALQSLLTNVIIDYFTELREDEQRRNHQQQLPMFVSSNKFVSQPPVSLTVPATEYVPYTKPIESAPIYPSDISDYSHM